VNSATLGSWVWSHRPYRRARGLLLVEIARKIQAPLLTTKVSHHAHRGDATAHDALPGVQTQSAHGSDDRVVSSAGRTTWRD
jgi:hypothetical protein